MSGNYTSTDLLHEKVGWAADHVHLLVGYAPKVALSKLVNCRAANRGGLCGDGKKEGTEQCDDGNLVDGDSCNKYCKIEAYCGNARSTPASNVTTVRTTARRVTAAASTALKVRDVNVPAGP